MSLDALRDLALQAHYAVIGLPITVTLLDLTVVNTSGIWLDAMVETRPFGTDFQTRQPRQVLSVGRTSTLRDIPRGSTILAAQLEGGPVHTWKVDGYDKFDADEMRLMLVRTSPDL